LVGVEVGVEVGAVVTGGVGGVGWPCWILLAWSALYAELLGFFAFERWLLLLFFLLMILLLATIIGGDGTTMRLGGSHVTGGKGITV
jgi:hypothetical protein